VAFRKPPGKTAAKNSPAAGSSGGILVNIFPGFFLAATLYESVKHGVIFVANMTPRLMDLYLLAQPFGTRKK